MFPAHGKDQCTAEEETKGLLETVFEDGVIVKTTSLKEVRALIESQS